jgi:hypothetical protein
MGGPQVDPSSLTVCSHVAPQLGPLCGGRRNGDSVSPFRAHAVSVTSNQTHPVSRRSSLVGRTGSPIVNRGPAYGAHPPPGRPPARDELPTTSQCQPMELSSPPRRYIHGTSAECTCAPTCSLAVCDAPSIVPFIWWCAHVMVASALFSETPPAR